MKQIILSIAVVMALYVAAIAEDVRSGSMPISPAVTQETIDGTICVKGYTRTVRPPVDVTRAIKSAKLKEMGLGDSYGRLFELDHIIPLTLGGAPRDLRNLKLQHWDDARRKDRVEACLGQAVCSGLVGLQDAREAIWRDWVRAARFCE